MSDYKSETQILNEICTFLEESKYFFWRSNNIPAGGRAFGSYRSLPKWTPKGLPDIFVVLGGMILGLEVKRGGEENVREKNGRKLREGKLTLEQEQFGISLVLAGGDFACVRSVEDVQEKIYSLVKQLPVKYH